MEQFNFDGYLKRGSASLSTPLYPVELTNSANGAMSFHLAIWLSGVDVTKFRILTDFQSGIINPKTAVLFEVQSEYDDFVKWWTKYQANFPPHRAYIHFLPPPPTNQKISGWSIHRPLRYDAVADKRESVTTEMFNEWSWISHNCQSLVWRIPGSWLFAEESDAVLFKLSMVK